VWSSDHHSAAGTRPPARREVASARRPAARRSCRRTTARGPATCTPCRSTGTRCSADQAYRVGPYPATGMRPAQPCRISGHVGTMSRDITVVPPAATLIATQPGASSGRCHQVRCERLGVRQERPAGPAGARGSTGLGRGRERWRGSPGARGRGAGARQARSLRRCELARQGRGERRAPARRRRRRGSDRAVRERPDPSSAPRCPPAWQGPPESRRRLGRHPVAPSASSRR